MSFGIGIIIGIVGTVLALFLIVWAFLAISERDKVKTAKMVKLLEDGELSGRALAKKFKAVYGRSIGYGTVYTLMRKAVENEIATVRDEVENEGDIDSTLTRYFSATEFGLVWQAKVLTAQEKGKVAA